MGLIKYNKKILRYLLQKCIITNVERRKFCHSSFKRNGKVKSVWIEGGVPKFEVDVSVSSPLRSSLPSIDPAAVCAPKSL